MVVCELCRSQPADNLHHLIPRTLHGNKWFRKRFSREQMQRGIHVCRQCHHAIHDLIPDEKELGRHYDTLEKLLAHPEIAKYVQWKRKRSQHHAAPSATDGPCALSVSPGSGRTRQYGGGAVRLGGRPHA